MTNRVLTAAAGVALLLPAVAFADVQAINGEAGMIFTDPPSTVSREQVRASIGTPVGVRGHWRLTGGEAVWTHNESRFLLQADGFVHASDCPVVAVLTEPAPARSPYPDLPVYRGA
jgi:hypothetical protein